MTAFSSQLNTNPALDKTDAFVDSGGASLSYKNRVEPSSYCTLILGKTSTMVANAYFVFRLLRPISNGLSGTAGIVTSVQEAGSRMSTLSPGRPIK